MSALVVTPKRVTQRKQMWRAWPATTYRRGKSLQMTEAMINACATETELKALAKERFRVLAKTSHPDVLGSSVRIGVKFQQQNAAYRWFMELPDDFRELCTGLLAGVPTPYLSVVPEMRWDMKPWPFGAQDARAYW